MCRKLIMQPMITLKYDAKSRLAGFADETKLVWVLCLSVVILFANHILAQVLLSVCLLLVSLYGGMKITYMAEYIKLFSPVILVIFLFHLFHDPGSPLFKIWFLTATSDGLHAGVLNLFRFVNFLLVAICFFSWTSPVSISTKIATVFGLAKSRFFQELALVFFIALRFLPVLIRERHNLKLAMRARAFDTRGSLINRLKVNIKIMMPLISRVAGQTDEVAAALALKGDDGVYFVPGRIALKAGDVLLILIGMTLAVLVICYG
jgi:energy-coupling factor transport system permease protein